MSNQSLIRRNDATLSIELTDYAKELKQLALDQSGIIGRVNTAAENACAALAQQSCRDVIALVEKERQENKAPVLAYGRKLDKVCADFVEEVIQDEERLSLLIGDFQQHENEKQRASLLAHNQNLSDLERERETAIANAKTPEEVDSIREHYNDKIRALAPPIEPARAPGQVVRQDWDIQVTNPYELAKYHPNCCDIKPRLSEIKDLLNRGIKVVGVEAKPITKASTRKSRERAAIEI